MVNGAYTRLSQRIFGMLWFFYGLCGFTIYLSVADQALGKAGLLPIPATFGGIAFLLPFVLRTLVNDLWQKHLSHFVWPITASKWPVLIFALLAFWSLTLSLLPGAYWDEAAKWIFLLTYGFLMAMCALYVPLQPTVRASLRLYTFVALTVLLISMVVDLIHPGTFSSEPNRAAGFPGNSNYAALIAVILCASALDYSRRSSVWFDLAFIGVTVLALLATMSRSGMVHFAVLSAFYFYHRFIRGGVRLREIMKLAAGFGLGLMVLIAALPVIMGDLAVFQGNTRLGRFLSNKQVDDGSAASRLGAALDAIRLIDESPILGHGTAHSRTMAELPHNLYLMQWVNNGLPGLLTYLAFLGISYGAFRRRNFPAGQALILVATTGSGFSHNVLDQRPFLMLWGILMTRSLLERKAISKATQAASVPYSQTSRSKAPSDAPQHLASWTKTLGRGPSVTGGGA